MASSGNFCTWNPLAQGNKSDIAFSSGNCAVTSGSGQFKSLSNFVIPTNSGKWYVEVCLTSNSGNTSYVGIVSEKSPDLNLFVFESYSQVTPPKSVCDCLFCISFATSSI